MEIANRLAEFREKRGFSAAALAKNIRVSRQTIYAMEAGDYVPNTAVALKLARTLEATGRGPFPPAHLLQLLKQRTNLLPHALGERRQIVIAAASRPAVRPASAEPRSDLARL